MYCSYVLFDKDEEPARLAMIHREWLRELSAQFELAWASA